MAAKLWKYLQKPASFSIRTESPRAAAARSRAVFSGPIGVSIIPEEARTKRKGGEAEAFEPTSPKVSCIGQVKKQHNKKIKSFKDKKNKIKSKIKKPAAEAAAVEEERERKEGRKKPPVAPSGIRQMFRRKVRPGRREEEVEVEVEVEPEIGMMRRFRSGREALADFDWRTVVESGSDGEDDEVIVPHSAPILMGGGEVAAEPKKEVNLWKRRTVAPPVPLEIK